MMFAKLSVSESFNARYGVLNIFLDDIYDADQELKKRL